MSELPDYIAPIKQPPFSMIYTIVGVSFVCFMVLAGLVAWIVKSVHSGQTYRRLELLGLGTSTAQEQEDIMSHFSPATLSFHHLNYDITRGKETIRCLNNVCGHVKPGQVMAIMGVSGLRRTEDGGLIVSQVLEKPLASIFWQARKNAA